MTDDGSAGAAERRGPRRGTRPWAGLALATAAWAAGSVLAFAELDPILAAFLVILAGTALVMGALARDWDRHSTFEERELARARKRAQKWDRSKDARARDRARWEAHQARQANKGDR